MFADAKHLKNELNLGRLDGLVSSPNQNCRVRAIDSKKIAAILLETNTVELQRHLLTLTVQNQVSLVAGCRFPFECNQFFVSFLSFIRICECFYLRCNGELPDPNIIILTHSGIPIH